MGSRVVSFDAHKFLILRGVQFTLFCCLRFWCNSQEIIYKSNIMKISFIFSFGSFNSFNS